MQNSKELIKKKVVEVKEDLFGRTFYFKTLADRDEFMNVWNKNVIKIVPDVHNGEEHKIILQVNAGVVTIKSGKEYLDGVQVDVHDYDVNDVDDDTLETDEDGGKYYVEEIY